MPFDGTTAAPIATKLRAVFGPKGERWCVGALTDTLGRHCLLGAIREAFDPRDHYTEMQLAILFVGSLMPGPHFPGIDNEVLIIRFNDSRKNFHEIANLLDRLEQLELAKGK